MSSNASLLVEILAVIAFSTLFSLGGGNGPASSNPNFAATNALAHKKTNVIFRIKSIKIFKPLVRKLMLSFLLNLTSHSFKV